ncbi:hypothetical protein [Thermococcus sp.]
MKKRTLLGIFVVLLVVGAYGVYVISYPQYPKINKCVNPFREVKPIYQTQENWSKIHFIFAVLTNRDLLKLAKPWNIDYNLTWVSKFKLQYGKEQVSMTAIAIVLKNHKRAVVLYKFSKPVDGVYTLTKVLSFSNNTAHVTSMIINGYEIQTSSCINECGSCDILEHCESYCCEPCANTQCMAYCAAPGCYLACGWLPYPIALPCWMACAGFCCEYVCCGQEGAKCVPNYIGP